MASKIIRSDIQARKLVSMVLALYKSCDVAMKVGDDVFICNKLVLTMQSAYFQERFFPATLDSITVDDVKPEDFRTVLSFLNSGETELNPFNVVGVYHTSKLFHLDDLAKTCWQYLKKTVVPSIETCVSYWKVTDSEGDFKTSRKCLNLFVDNIIQITRTTDSKDIHQELMKRALKRDDLNIKNEEVVCEILLKWFDANHVNGQLIQPLELLTLIRWSGVSFEYLKSTMTCHELLKNDQVCSSYLSRVSSYRFNGTQFPGLLTHHRRSSTLDTFVLIFGTIHEEGLPFIFDDVITRKIYCVSLQRKNVIGRISDLPSTLQPSMCACVNKNSVYVTGVGFYCRKTWRWDLIGGWVRCGDMVEGRRKHFSTFINNTTMYTLGGYLGSTLSSVERFNTMENKWKTVGQLTKPIYNAGGALYKSSIYLFGGKYDDKTPFKRWITSWIQQYDTTTEQCTLLSTLLPKVQKGLRAVLWDESVILMNDVTCCIYHFESNTLQQRDGFRALRKKFGLVIDNQSLFIIGGSYVKTMFCIPVMDIIDNKPSTWTLHCKLKYRSPVQAYAVMNLTHRE